MKLRATNCRRLGMSMLELVIASSLLAMVLATVGVVMRSGRQAWEAHSDDYRRVEAAHATVRHIVRQVRQAIAVSQISSSTDSSGRLSLQMQDGSTVVWDHDDASDSVQYGVTTPSSLLAPEITGLRFIGYLANGTTVTANPAEVQAVRVEVTIQLPVEVNATRVISSWAWIRSW
jgi:type II secretory pathway component PulJ